MMNVDIPTVDEALLNLDGTSGSSKTGATETA